MSQQVFERNDASIVPLFLSYSDLAHAWATQSVTMDDLSRALFYLDLDHRDLRRQPLALRRILRQARCEGRLLWKSNGLQHLDDFNQLLQRNGFPAINGHRDPLTSFEIGGGWIDLRGVVDALQRQIRCIKDGILLFFLGRSV